MTDAPPPPSQPPFQPPFQPPSYPPGPFQTPPQGPPQGPPPFGVPAATEPAPAPPRRDRGRLLVIAGVLGGLVAVGVYAFLNRESSPHPSEWDERVVDLVAFVEDERGEEFLHPVHVDFLTAEEYSESRRGDAGELSEEDEAEIERAEGLFRALGLAGSDLDLFESTNDLSDTGTLAFYDLVEERIVVRGTEVTPSLSVTLVHELTHALQDQIFDLDLLRDPGDATSGSTLAMRALVEGDATHIEDAFKETLTDAERTEIDAEDEDDRTELEEAEIPEALVALFAMPYALGEGFIAALEAESSREIDRAFADPPSTEEHLLDPRTFLDSDQPHVVRVSVPDDVEILDEGDFGAASLMVVLGARIDAADALVAAVGWGGDEYATYELDGRTCIDLAVSTDTPEDELELALALSAWVAAGPEGAASTEVVDGEVLLHACDPGAAEVEDPPASSMDTLVLALLRNTVISDGVASGMPEPFARCYGDAVVQAFTVEELTGDAPPPNMDARLTAAAQGCA